MQYLDLMSYAIGIVGITIVVWGLITGLYELLRTEYIHFRVSSKAHIPLDFIRYSVGRYLLLGLEFLVADDIIRTIVRPTLEDVAILAAIVAIRTVISYFLAREIREREAGRK